MNLLANAIRSLSAALKSTAGESVTYRRATDSIDGLVATPARTSPEDYSLDADIALSAMDRDWIVWVDDLAFASQRSLPQSGDEIDFTDATGTLRTYRVGVRSKEGGRPYRYTDPTMQMYRIFTTEKKPSAE